MALVRLIAEPSSSNRLGAERESSNLTSNLKTKQLSFFQS